MIRHLRKRKGYLLPQVLAMILMLSITGIALVAQLSAFLSGVEAGGEGLQAKQYAAIKADAITSYTAAADEARALYPGSEFETETIIGPETDLGSGNKQKIATVNVYKTGDSAPRFTLLKPLSSQGSGSNGIDYNAMTTSSLPFTAPVNGIAYINCYYANVSGVNGGSFYVNGISYLNDWSDASWNNSQTTTTAILNKGDIVTNSSGFVWVKITFIPFK